MPPSLPKYTVLLDNAVKPRCFNNDVLVGVHTPNLREVSSAIRAAKERDAADDNVIGVGRINPERIVIPALVL